MPLYYLIRAAKPIDLLAKYVNSNEEDMDIEVQEPYLLLRGLNIVDLEDLLEDIKVYCEMELNANTEFWSVSPSSNDDLYRISTPHPPLCARI